MTAESISYVIAPYIDAVNVMNTSLTITSNTVPTASSYTIQLSESLDFATVAFEATGSTPVLPFGGLKFNTVYYNRVRTNFSTEFGEVRKFTTRPSPSMRAASARLETSDEEIALKEFNVNVYPNPFRETLIFSVESSIHDKAGIKLIDLNGRTVHESIEKTNSIIEIKKPFANSVYLLRVNAGAFSKVVRVVRGE